MRHQDIHIIRQQLEKTLVPYGPLRNLKRPMGGWISSVRKALGMSNRQLAERMQVSGPRITKLEQDERSGSVTIKTMHRVAEELDCEFVYALVPRKSLENTVHAQAVRYVNRFANRVRHTMLLEAQQLSPNEEQSSREAAVDELVRDMPRDLWDTNNGL